MRMEIVVPPAEKNQALSRAVIVVCIAACVAYAVAATRNFRAAGLFLAGEVQRAKAFEPSNAEYSYVAGMQAMHEGDPRGAVAAYAEALRQNPRMPGAWLDYAYALRALGEHDKSLDALNHALAAAPSQPEVIFEAAGAKLAMGDAQSAFPLFRKLLDHSLEHGAEIVELCWRARPDPDALSEILLGSNAAAYREFLSFLYRRSQTAAAKTMFQDYLASKAPYVADLIGAHIDYLLAQHDVDSAESAWDAAAKRFPNLAQYRQPGNLIANPGFELDRINSGFGWHVDERPYITIADDRAHVADGSRSLKVVFDGVDDNDYGFSQLVPVQPGHPYTLSFTSMSKDLALEGSPRITVRDAFSKEELGASAALGAAEDWQRETVHFTTGPATRLIELRLDRPHSSRELMGKLWLDNFSLQ